MIDLIEIDRFAERAHAGQRYGNEPFINHPRRVAARLKTPLDKAVALLHDVCEDTTITVDEIEKRYGKIIADGVYAMTRQPEWIYNDYITRLSHFPRAVRVKIADLEENIYYAENVNKEFASLVPRYKKALAYLKAL